eukprot:scaffold91563_cov60-Phaeocystis_antarctica.AAC.4
MYDLTIMHKPYKVRVRQWLPPLTKAAVAVEAVAAPRSPEGRPGAARYSRGREPRRAILLGHWQGAASIPPCTWPFPPRGALSSAGLWHDKEGKGSGDGTASGAG